MYKAKTNELIGRTVISVDTGKPIGIIKDLICSWQEGLVEAICIEGISILLKSEYIIPIESCKKFAGDWMPLKPLDNFLVSNIEKINLWSTYKGLKVVSDWGREIGFLAELVFTFPKGKIEMVEISDGFLKDFIEGRSMIEFNAFEIFTEKMIIIKDEMVR